ncbi:MAG: OmpA family protein, partial [Balneolaceae bacterium]|nr:OmpA family protein [Balneolaceae bacterium]
YYEREFTNSYKSVSVTSQIGLLRLLGTKSKILKIYGDVGLGLVFNDVTTSVNNKIGQWEDFVGEDHTEYSMVGIFGGGVRLNVSHRIDLFAQYDYIISNSDLIDGYRTRPELQIDLHRRTPDNWSRFTAGIQIKLGGSDSDADWHRYDPTMDYSEIRRLEEQIAQLDRRVTDNSARLDEQDEYNTRIEQRMTEFEERLTNLEQMLEEEEAVELTIASDVLFAFDKSEIRETAKPTLARVADALFKNPDKDLLVVGPTDAIGTEAYNQGLSERRAASVKEYLVDAGISADRIMTQGMGETQPVASNDTPEGRQLNRRVEMTIE